MNQLKIIRMIIIATVALLLVACTSNKRSIQVNSQITEIPKSEHDFNIDNDEAYEDFRYYKLEVTGKNIKDTDKRVVVIPSYADIKNQLSKYGTGLCWGNAVADYNEKNSEFLYEYKLTFNMKKIPLDEFKNTLNKLKIKIQIERASGGNIYDMETSLGELLD